jgi:ferritin-like protein
MTEATHAPYDKLSRETLTLHQAIRSLIEELDAVDWYRQRADDCEDPQLKAILLHNMREEIEHAAMILEWLRRRNPDFAGHFQTYLYSAGDITAIEEAAGTPAPEPPPRFTVGPMK